MSKVAFDGIGETVATFYTEGTVTAGEVVKVSDDSSVSACASGDRFCGVAVSVKDGCAGVQVKGFARVSSADSSITAGYVNLEADGNGGVQKAANGGDEYLVIAADTDSVIILL